MRNFILFLFPLSTLLSAVAPLTHKDVRLTMREMLAYHVEQKEFTPLLVKRSFKIYIEQFDPEKVYLTQSEIASFLSPSNKRIKKVIEEYHRDDFREYYALNRVVLKAIKRHRVIRQQVIAQIVQNGPATAQERQSYVNYAANEEELKERIAAHLGRSIQRDAKKRHIVSIDSKTLPQMAAFWEKKRLSAERGYLGAENVEHAIVFHILKSLAKSLDAHTGYYSPDEAYELRTMLQKQLTGVGLVFHEEFDGIYVAEVLQGGPAAQNGSIRTGDRLLKVNEHDIDTLPYNKVLAELKGEQGSKIRLEFARDNEFYKLKLRRAKVIVEDERLSYTYEPVADGIIGKIDLPGFYDNGGSLSAERDLRNALRDLKSIAPLKGLVLDMRQNTGGFLNQAVKVAGMFLTGGVVVISRYSDGEMNYSRDIDGRQYYEGPLVVLTSKVSASAAEIVAQALQDHGAAIVVGDKRTYGKGSMQYQTITDERAKAFFKVTVGRYYTASGRSPQIEGVIGDVYVPTRFSPYLIGERYLEYPISRDKLSRNLAKAPNIPDVVPYLKPRESSFRQMLPALNTNSTQRLDKSRNFLFYRKLLNGDRPDKPKKITRMSFRESNFGVVDLQLHECVSLLKDMMLIQEGSNKAQ